MIRTTMDEVARELGGWRAAESLHGLDHLRRALETHHGHEEAELYPAVLALKLAPRR